VNDVYFHNSKYTKGKTFSSNEMVIQWCGRVFRKR
jgi:hypothetical protein